MGLHYTWVRLRCLLHQCIVLLRRRLPIGSYLRETFRAIVRYTKKAFIFKLLQGELLKPSCKEHPEDCSRCLAHKPKLPGAVRQNLHDYAGPLQHVELLGLLSVCKQLPCVLSHSPYQHGGLHHMTRIGLCFLFPEKGGVKTSKAPAAKGCVRSQKASQIVCFSQLPLP